MLQFTDKDKEFLTQAELFYSGGQPTWSDLEYDSYRPNFESRFGDVTKYVKSLNQGEHIDHRESARFKLNKISIPSQFKERCDYLMSNSPKSYWMYKYDGCSVVGYYNNGKLVQVCTKSAVEWGIDRTTTLGWLFPQYVSPDIDSIQGEAVVKVSEVGGAYKARSAANGLTNSIYKVQQIHDLIHIRAFKVGFTDLDSSVERMVNALKSLPIPEHGKFQIAKELTLDDVSDSPIGTEDILYDGIVRYGYEDNQIIGYKKHASEHLITKIKYIEWNMSPQGLMVPKYVFEPVWFDAIYNEDGELTGGIKVQRASCGSANRLFSIGGGAGAVVEVFRANATIPQVSKVLIPSSDYCLDWMDKRYYEEDYEFNYKADPWKVIGNSGYYTARAGIMTDNITITMKENIERWIGSIDAWKELQVSNPREFLKYVYYKNNFKGRLNLIDEPNARWFGEELLSGDPNKFDEFTKMIYDWLGYTGGDVEKMISVKDELLNLVTNE